MSAPPSPATGTGSRYQHLTVRDGDYDTDLPAQTYPNLPVKRATDKKQEARSPTQAVFHRLSPNSFESGRLPSCRLWQQRGCPARTRQKVWSLQMTASLCPQLRVTVLSALRTLSTLGQVFLSSLLHLFIRVHSPGVYPCFQAWYFEVIVAHLGGSGHARVGWANNKAELNAPVGFDGYGYGYCDVGGEKVHEARREPYGESYAAGDVIGCYIFIEPLMEQPPGGHLPECAPGNSAASSDVNCMFDGVAEHGSLGDVAKVHEANAEVCWADGTNSYSGGKESKTEDADHHLPADSAVTSQSREVTYAYASAPNPTEGNNVGFVAFAKNGILQGIAYQSLRTGKYCPVVSLYTLPKVEPLARITFNFGPTFVHGCADFGDLPSPKPISDRAPSPRVKSAGKLEDVAVDEVTEEGNSGVRETARGPTSDDGNIETRARALENTDGAANVANKAFLAKETVELSSEMRDYIHSAANTSDVSSPNLLGSGDAPGALPEPAWQVGFQGLSG